MLSQDDKITLYMRPGCHVCARVKAFLTDNGVPFTVRDVDAEPLTPDELWALFNKKADRLRVPFTAVNDGDDVVLGYDPLRLEGVLLRGDRGGWQASTALAGERTYESDLPRGWTSDAEGHVSTERFATPPGSHLEAEVGMSVRADPPAFAGLRLHDVAGGIIFGFEVTSSAVFAVHRRLALPGVNLPEETFAHRVELGLPTTPGESHRYRIAYQHDSGQVDWHVDGVRAYWSTTPRPVEGMSLGMSAGPDARARWTPWLIRTK